MNPHKLALWLFACTLIVRALWAGLLTGANQHIYHLWNMRTSIFAYRHDDFLSCLPIIVMFILRFAGVKSHSNWKHMLVSAALVYALMGTIVISMKLLAGVLCPDDSDSLSFPSGHTTAVFTAATLLYKEYDFKIPLAIIATFLPAVATGFIRQLNNRH